MLKKETRGPSKWLRVLIPSVLITIWFVLAGIGGPYFGRIEEVSEIDLTAFLPKSAESTEVNEISRKFRDENLLPAIVVFEAKEGGVSEYTARFDQVGEQIESVEGVASEVSPALISDDQKAAFIVVPISADSEVGEVVAEIREEAKDTGFDDVAAYVTGPAGFSADLNVAFAGIDGLLLAVALAVVFVILIIVYRSPLLPVLVLLTSVFALAVSILIVWQLAARDVVQLNGQVQGILFILVIGAATDYSLLYVSRFREELHRTASTWQATRRALKGALEPILASGGTVIVGLLCLLFSELSSNSALGPVGSIGILMAMLAALTLLPALLIATGRGAFWPLVPRVDTAKSAEYKGGTIWQGVGKLVTRWPRRIWMVTTALLLIATIGVTQLRADGVAQSELILGYSEAREGQQALNRHFPAGSGSPALIVVPESQVDKAVSALDDDTGIASVSAVAKDSPSGQLPLGEEEERIKAEFREAIEQQFAIAQQQFGPDVTAGGPSIDQTLERAYPFRDIKPTINDGQVLLQATLRNAPDSDEAKETIQRIRSELRQVVPAAKVGGTTAVQLDTNTASLRDRAIIIPLVLAAITIILMLLLRSIIAPVLLLLTTVLSFGATLGIAALLFNTVLDFPGADPSVVLYGFVFLVALGIDYNIFLMTRVREETLLLGTREGVIRGLVVTGGVITSAGIVLAATFAALAVIPILFLAQLAFVVAFGVLLDTLVVRSLLVPALIRDFGSVVWWPSKLRSKQ